MRTAIACSSSLVRSGNSLISCRYFEIQEFRSVERFAIRFRPSPLPKTGLRDAFYLDFNGIALYTSVKFLEGCWLQFCDTKREPRTEGPGWAGSVAPDGNRYGV